jgi:hypothetical protein
MEYLNKNKTIVVKSSPGNIHYDNFKAALETPNVRDGLKQRDLEVVQDAAATNNGFNFYLYGQDGSLFLNEKSYDNDTMDNLFGLIDNMTPKPSQSGGAKGGSVDYQQKYFKYKSKYDELQNVITSFSN